MALHEEIREKIKRSAPLSVSAQHLLSVTSNERHSLREVISIVECDSVLTAQVLRTANSAAFKPRGETATVAMAVSLMGERVVVGAALDLCAKSVYQAPLEGYCGSPGGLWRHSLLAALAAKETARAAREPLNEGVAFTAGILHDIGKSVLSSFLKGKVGELLDNLEREGGKVSYLDAERSLLGINHCEAGAALAEHWQLPETLTTAIRFHHEPAKAPDKFSSLAYATHIGDVIAMMLGVADGSDGMRYKMDPGYAEKFLLATNDVGMIMESVLAAFEKTQTAMGYG